MPRGVYKRSSKNQEVTAKQKISKAVKAAKVPEPEVKKDEATPLVLEQHELLRLLRYDAESRALKSEILVLGAQRDALLQAIDPAGRVKKMEAETQTRRQSLGITATEYNLVIKEVEERLGIKMSNFAYDDKTGVLNTIANASSVPEK